MTIRTVHEKSLQEFSILTTPCVPTVQGVSSAVLLTVCTVCRLERSVWKSSYTANQGIALPFLVPMCVFLLRALHLIPSRMWTVQRGDAAVRTLWQEDCGEDEVLGAKTLGQGMHEQHKALHWAARYGHVPTVRFVRSCVSARVRVRACMPVCSCVILSSCVWSSLLAKNRIGMQSSCCRQSPQIWRMNASGHERYF